MEGSEKWGQKLTVDEQIPDEIQVEEDSPAAAVSEDQNPGEKRSEAKKARENEPEDQNPNENGAEDQNPSDDKQVPENEVNQIEKEGLVNVPAELDHCTIGKHEPVTPNSRIENSNAKAEDDNRERFKGGVHESKMTEEEETGTPEDQDAFIKELEIFYKERSMDFKPPKFYQHPLNCLKLYRAVTRLGGYDLVTGTKLWRQVGESFHPPKTCTTVSWTFRNFYEKSLLEYERHNRQNGELQLAVAVLPGCIDENEANCSQAPGSGRARRDSAARAMQGWHTQRFSGYGEVRKPIIKDKNFNNMQKREKSLKSIVKHKRPTELEHAVKAARTETSEQLAITVVDLGPPADWVKINVLETRDGFEVYALVPGLLREEVRVQSDPAGRLVITGQPEQLDNPWGVTGFKKVVSLPARIDPLQTSAVVSLHGRLFVRVPFEQPMF